MSDRTRSISFTDIVLKEKYIQVSALTALHHQSTETTPLFPQFWWTFQSCKVCISSREIKKEESKELPSHDYHSTPTLTLPKYTASGWCKQGSWTYNILLNENEQPKESTHHFFAAFSNSTYVHGYKARKCCHQSSSTWKHSKRNLAEKLLKKE